MPFLRKWQNIFQQGVDFFEDKAIFRNHWIISLVRRIRWRCIKL